MNQRNLGMLQVALAAVAWSFGGVFAKWLPWSSLTVHGLRTLIAGLFLTLFRRSWKANVTPGNLLGALGTTLTTLLYMLSVKLTTAANAIVLQYAMPVFVIAFCWIFYRQKPTRANVIAAAFILLGVVLCSVEGMSGGSLLGDALALLSAVTFSLVFFCSRLPGATATDYTYIGHLFGAPFVVCAFFDPAMSADPIQWLAIIAMAFCLASGYYLMSLGMRRVAPVPAALLSNLEPILNPFWVFLFLGEQPDALTLVGVAIVLVSSTIYSVAGNRKTSA